MSVYHDGDFLPLPVRVALAQLERRALAEGLAARHDPPAAAPPASPAPPAPQQQEQQDTQRDDLRIWRYRALAALVSLLCAGAFAVLGRAIVTSDLSVFAALATLAVFGFALTLLEAWALPSVYRWVYWRYLLVSWR